MGQESSMNRGHRFIEEFNEDAQKRFSIDASCMTTQGLGFDDCLNVVRMYHGIQATKGDVEVMSEGIIYDPQADDDTVIEATMIGFDLDEATAIARLKKASLIDPATEVSE